MRVWHLSAHLAPERMLPRTAVVWGGGLFLVCQVREPWLEELPTRGPDGALQWKPALFVCSFIVLSVWVVLQVRSE